ncbi:MAG: hypothetical protein GXO40_01310 [Epsilonproteobacteria bacterium]|nr:hypothetical protein [Campylobacterota bacterium]
MKEALIASVKNYSETMLDMDIEVVKGFEFDKCVVSSIGIDADNKHVTIFINSEYESLMKLAEILFGFKDDGLIEDLQKELINTIGGYFADHYYKKGYKLQLPNIEKNCSTKYCLFFKNDILKICIRVKVKNGS